MKTPARKPFGQEDWRKSLRLWAVVCLPIVICVGFGCERAVPPGPTGQPVVPWMEPFDREALTAAMPNYRSADLSSYNFALLLVVQNYVETGFSVTLEVNGQDMERRYVAGLTQEIFAVTDAMVQQTEQAFADSPANFEPRLEGQPCPFVVRLRQYVTEDGYVIKNTNFLLAPENLFESMSSDPDLPLDETYTLDAHHICPGAFAIVVRQSHVDVVELDREFIGVNEPDDDTDIVIESDLSFPIPFFYHQETVLALEAMDMLWLIGAPHESENPSPANGADGISLAPVLTWEPAAQATSYDVYFGTFQPGEFQGNQTTNEFIPGTLEPDTTYYWRVDAVNGLAVTTGQVWTFTTVE